MAFKNQVVAGFSILTAETEVLSWSASPASTPHFWLELFVSLYPNLTLPELARIKAQPWQHFFEFNSLLEKYHYRTSANLLRLLDLLAQLPSELQDYLSEKKYAPKELSIIALVPFELAEKTLAFIKMQNFSKSQGAQALEWLLEIQMQAANDSLAGLSEYQAATADLSLEKIHRSRYPLTQIRDEQKEKDLRQKLERAWPQSLQAQFLRKGDRSGFELKLFVSNPVELKKYILNLEKVAAEWKE